MKLLSRIACLAALTVIGAAQSFAAGIENVRWQTTFKSPQGDAYCDLYVFNTSQAYLYPTNGSQADGVLSITGVSNDGMGRISNFRGTWSRGGSQGTFNFYPQYQGNSMEAYYLNGFYVNSATGPGVAYNWTGTPSP